MYFVHLCIIHFDFFSLSKRERIRGDKNEINKRRREERKENGEG
ncbi:hypothetical protein BDCR2A_02047 [Borrelia duttonii CR2A]|uniref:Uncharacterized protein n=1 Tax=Borrelia duttonii CR2A TaxID=1432657 RepID=W6TIV9_9SPIR|nr:hypothetical protein BDCR2A_02047 [Borrelia duttonii CR2A]